MCFLLRFFLCGYDMVNSSSSYKRVYYINFRLGFFNLLIQFCKLSLIFALSFYYIQIICRHKHIKQMANSINLILCIFR